MARDSLIVVINAGSSSIKAACFSSAPVPRRLWSGAADRIGLKTATLRIHDASGKELVHDARPMNSHEVALRELIEFVEREGETDALIAVGHRVVHGGNDYDHHVLVTPALEEHLQRIVNLAPLHLPHNLSGIRAVHRLRPDLPQVACFDTVFHHKLPHLARMTSLPRDFEREGIRRYGFHGLSYEYVVDHLRRRHGDAIQGERIVIAHLGAGASMTAVHEGRSIETTMGFSTLSGLPMGTRCGDLDPGIVLFLLAAKSVSVQNIERLLYEESGLLGMSGISPNMQDLLARPNDSAAVQAIDFFCYQARKQLGALAATLGGLERLVFTGGIGAHAPTVRREICESLTFLGIRIDEDRNRRGELVISAEESPVKVEAFPTDEELMIARHVRAILAEGLAGQEASRQ